MSEYIGRQGPPRWAKRSIWANPFRLSKAWSRVEAVEAYRVYVEADPVLMALLPTLRGKVLDCPCGGKPCHGDILRDLAAGTDLKGGE